MVHIHIERIIDADADEIWAIISEFETGPVRMSPGLVTDSSYDDGSELRVVTFVNGATVRERRIDIDHTSRRLVYSVVGGSYPTTHDNAVMQVLPVGPGRSRFLWSRDVLPAAVAEPMGKFMAMAIDRIKTTMEAHAASTDTRS